MRKAMILAGALILAGCASNMTPEERANMGMMLYGMGGALKAADPAPAPRPMGITQCRPLGNGMIQCNQF